MTALATPDRDRAREAAGVRRGAPLRMDGRASAPPRADGRSSAAPRVGGGDEALARRTLRAQIARLESDLAEQRASARRSATFAELIRGEQTSGRGAAAIARTAPRLLSLGELEAQRDALADRLAGERAALALAADRQEGFRRLREEMLLDPAAHQHVRVSNADVGEPGCLDWHVRPRFGVLGMLMRWWRVKISSGCP